MVTVFLVFILGLMVLDVLFQCFFFLGGGGYLFKFYPLINIEVYIF